MTRKTYKMKLSLIRARKLFKLAKFHGEIVSARRCRGTIRAVNAYGDVYYLYRGVIIETTDDDTYNPFVVDLPGYGWARFETLSEVKQVIDHRADGGGR